MAGEMKMTVPVQAISGGESDKYRALAEKISSEIRVAAPGIIQAYNAATNTATVQLAIRERVSQPDGTSADTAIPMLLDCPVMMPRGGGYALTFPVAAGDECLVIFADSCIDAWWQSGGIQKLHTAIRPAVLNADIALTADLHPVQRMEVPVENGGLLRIQGIHDQNH